MGKTLFIKIGQGMEYVACDVAKFAAKVRHRMHPSITHTHVAFKELASSIPLLAKSACLDVFLKAVAVVL